MEPPWEAAQWVQGSRERSLPVAPQRADPHPGGGKSDGGVMPGLDDEEFYFVKVKNAWPEGRMEGRLFADRQS